MVKTIIPTGNGGELSRRMEGRVDLDGIYDRGFAEMFNFVPTVEGPIGKRPGTRHIAAGFGSWISSYVPQLRQGYILEWGEQALRFYTNGGQIRDGANPYQISTPYAAADARKIWKHKSKDRLYLTHASYPPASLNRTGAAVFNVAPLPLMRGPFKTQNGDEAIRVNVSATTGTAVATASAAIFKPGHVGAPFLIEAQDFSDVTAWEPGYNGVTIGAKRRSDGKVYQAETAGKTGTVQPTHTEGTEYDGAAIGKDINDKDAGGIKWTYLYDRFGEATIATVAPDGLSATLNITRRFADSLVSTPSFRWAHCAFSAAEGWPHLACIWAGRLFLFKELEFYGSVRNDFFNFAYYTDGGLFAEDMAFRRTLGSSEAPIWVKADQQLLVGTPSGELLLGAINSQAGVSGDNIDAFPQSSYGSSDVEPVDIGTGILFVQRGNRKIREAEYQFERNRFVGVNTTIYARHIMRSGLLQLAYQQEPEELVWGVRNDGVMIAHAHSPEQQIKGFSRAALGAGRALSLATIPADNAETDELWILADLDGTRAVLQLGDWWEEDEDATDLEQLAKLKEAFFVDFGVSYRGAPKTSFTQGLSHLAGRDVRILADGGVVGGRSVTQAGVLTPDLPYPASTVHIGIGYQARLKPMRPELRGAGTVQGRRKRVVKIMLRLIDTAAAYLRNPKGHLDSMIDRPRNANMDEPVPLFNGDTKNTSYSGAYDRDGQPVIVSDDPLPMMISAIMPDIEIEN